MIDYYAQEGAESKMPTGAKFLIKNLHGPAPGDRITGWLTLPIQMPEGWPHWNWNSPEQTAFRYAAAKAAKESLPSMPNLVADPADKGTRKGCKWQVCWDQRGPLVIVRPEERGGSYISVRPIPPSMDVPMTEWERIYLYG